MRLPDHRGVRGAAGRSQRAPGVAVADEGDPGDGVRLEGVAVRCLGPEPAQMPVTLLRPYTLNPVLLAPQM